MKKNYLVRWEIDIEAEDEFEAAKMAREIQLDPKSTATIFEVMGDYNKVDLEDLNNG